MKRLIAVSLLLLSACASTSTTSGRIALPAPPPTGEPTGFVGLSGNQLRAAYGVPTLQRKENGSELWRYDNRQCRVFFFLYPVGRDLVVRHVETLPRGRDQATDSSCLTALRARPASPVS